LGEAKRGSSATGFKGWPHSEQNFAVDDTELPQLIQARVSGAAHCSQNFASSLFTWRQFAHFIVKPAGGRTTCPANVTSRTRAGKIHLLPGRLAVLGLVLLF